MAAGLRVPAGRTGRLWLRQRLALAGRAESLLEVKVGLLRAELDRLDRLAAQTEEDWRRACREAALWGSRVAVGGGARDLRLMRPAGQAELTVTETSLMGIGFPASVSCRFPERSPSLPVIGSSAMVAAIRVHEQALRVGAAHAVATAARAAVAREVATTSQRLRALRDRWIPRLEAALRETEAALEELERAEASRLRWAIDRPSDDRAGA